MYLWVVRTESLGPASFDPAFGARIGECVFCVELNCRGYLVVPDPQAPSVKGQESYAGLGGREDGKGVCHVPFVSGGGRPFSSPSSGSQSPKACCVLCTLQRLGSSPSVGE